MNILPGPKAQPPLVLNLEPFGDNYFPLQQSPARSSKFSVAVEAMDDMSKYMEVTPVPSNDTMDSFMLETFEKSGFSFTKFHYLAGAIIDSSAKSVTAFFNGEAYHTPAIAQNLIHNAVIRLSGGKVRIQTTNHPLPPTSLNKAEDSLAGGLAQFILSFELIAAMAFLSSSFVVYTVAERATKSKHLQLLTGVHPFTYWLSAFVWDYCSYVICSTLIILLYAVFKVDTLVTENNLGFVLLILLFYGWAILPLQYAGSFLFTSSTAAFVNMTIYNVLSGVMPLVTIEIMDQLVDERITRIVEWVFIVVFPTFCLGQGFSTFYLQQFAIKTCSPIIFLCSFADIGFCCQSSGSNSIAPSSWNKPGIGRMLFFMIIQGFIHWLIVCLVEIRFSNLIAQEYRRHHNTAKLQKPLSDQQCNGNTYGSLETAIIDKDVLTEKERILQSSGKESVTVKHLVKCYGSLKAVDDITFGVEAGECFGLLGANGAGKTSTFQMLTGENTVTSGDADLMGISVLTDWRKAGRNLGYCPQFDAIIENLSGEENLTLFARLRGIPEAHIPSEVQEVVNLVGLSKYQNTLSKTYSGGNKRKLSLGLALIGRPPILLLDEPTTGVDPAARRHIWDVLSKTCDFGAAIILSSHSMEECEALCSGLTIMAKGELQCIGSPQHLKQKFGSGYTLEVKLDNVHAARAAMSSITHLFPDITLKEVQNNQMTFNLPKTEASSLSRIFGTLQKLVEPLGIQDYSLSQTTLDQVFLQLSSLSH